MATDLPKIIQGSGRTSFVPKPAVRRLFIGQVDSHPRNIGGATLPVVASDTPQHACYRQFRNEKAEWLGAFREIVNWINAAGRLRNVSTVNLSVGGVG